MNKFNTLKLLVKSAKLVEYVRVHNYAKDNDEIWYEELAFKTFTTIINVALSNKTDIIDFMIGSENHKTVEEKLHWFHKQFRATDPFEFELIHLNSLMWECLAGSKIAWFVVECVIKEEKEFLDIVNGTDHEHWRVNDMNYYVRKNLWKL